MKKLVLTYLFAALSFLVSIAQTAKEEFKVLSQKGSNTVNSKPLSSGAKLYGADKLTIGAGGFVGLLHKSGKTVELRQAGTFEISDLSAKVSGTSVSTSKRYTDFVLNELTKDGAEDINKNHRKHMTTTGSVERKDERIQVFLPTPAADSSVKIISQQLKISWKNFSKGKTYVIEASNEFSEPMFKQETIDTNIVIDLSKVKLGTDNEFYLQIFIKGENSKNYSDKRKIVVLKNNEIKEKEAELNASLTEESSLNHYVKALFYEENKLFVNAADSYQKAIQLDPEVSDYKEGYKSLLFGAGLRNFHPELKK